MELVRRRFEQFGFPLVVNRDVVIHDDDTTLFVCSGMQPNKHRFRNLDGGRYGSLQSCIRTDDIDLVGDGSHLTYFEMVGNFSFGSDEYELSIDLWDSILSDLNVTGTHIRVHPSQNQHRLLWQRRGYRVERDKNCVWSDGEIGGYCCEVFVGNLEIGNLVHPLGTCTDVGFGWERLVQVVEEKRRVDQTSLFDQRFCPVVSDHCRTISVLKENGVQPGNKGRNYICRRLLRRLLRRLDGTESFSFDDWLKSERELMDKCLREGRRFWRRHKDKPPSFWWETFGITPEEIHLLDS